MRPLWPPISKAMGLILEFQESGDVGTRSDQKLDRGEP